MLKVYLEWIIGMFEEILDMFVILLSIIFNLLSIYVVESINIYVYCLYLGIDYIVNVKKY